MMKAWELQEKLRIMLARPVGHSNDMYRDALASLAALVDDDEIEAYAAWFDYGHVEQAQGEVEIGVHTRLLLATGVVTLDHDFSFDGSPHANFIPWSRIDTLSVIAGISGDDPQITNAWLEFRMGRVEFAGARPSHLEAIVASARKYLA
jgi:hypothetical protein